MANGGANPRVHDLKVFALVVAVVSGFGGLVWTCFSWVSDVQSKHEAVKVYETKEHSKEQRAILRKQIDDSVMRIENMVEKQSARQEKMQDTFQKEWRALRREIRRR